MTKEIEMSQIISSLTILVGVSFKLGNSTYADLLRREADVLVEATGFFGGGIAALRAVEEAPATLLELVVEAPRDGREVVLPGLVILGRELVDARGVAGVRAVVVDGRELVEDESVLRRSEALGRGLEDAAVRAVDVVLLPPAVMRLDSPFWVPLFPSSPEVID
jgi:hypothetical protein